MQLEFQARNDSKYPLRAAERINGCILHAFTGSINRIDTVGVFSHCAKAQMVEATGIGCKHPAEGRRISCCKVDTEA